MGLIHEEELALAEAHGLLVGALGKRVLWPACAYAAEVLRRAVPDAELSSVDGELVVTLPSRIVPRGSFKVMPLVRVRKLLCYEETLYGWAVFFLGLAGYGDAGADACRL